MQDPRLGATFHKSESSKYLGLTVPYLCGNGIDLGSGGWPVVPWAIQIEQTAEEFTRYNQRPPPSTIEWLGTIFDLPFKDGVLDWVYSSHLIEDFNQGEHWPKLFREWARVLKPGGLMILLVPEKERWAAYIARGGVPNCSHWAPEPSVGDMSRVAQSAGLVVVEERLTEIDELDFSILGVFRKPK